MQEYEHWKSLVDLQEYPALPDSGGNHQWDFTEGSDSFVADVNGDLNADFTSISWATGSGTDNVFAELDGENYADLGSESRPKLSHFVRDGKGTAFAWVKPSDSSDMRAIYGTNFSNSDASIMLWKRGDNDDYQWYCGNGDDSNVWNISGGEPSTDWVALAGTADGSTAQLYIAEPPDYSISEIGTESVSGTRDVDLDTNVYIGRPADNPERNWDGGIDLSFIDDKGWTESELQSFVDDSKELYE